MDTEKGQMMSNYKNELNEITRNIMDFNDRASRSTLAALDSNWTRYERKVRKITVDGKECILVS